MKSLFFPGGRNCKLSLIFSLVTILCFNAQARILYDNFEAYTPGSSTSAASISGGDENAFQHEIQGFGLSPLPIYWEINQSALKCGDGSFTKAAMDVITFDLAGNDFVDFVSVDYLDLGGYTSIEIYDIDNNIFSLQRPVNGSWTTFDSSGSGFTEIARIEIGSYNGSFDNITINVVPEPMTLSLLGLGSILLRRRKKK